jgi:competence protein ComEC
LRLVLATREPVTARAIRVRLNVPLENDEAGAVEGAVVRVKARLMPPAPPMLPGSYNFARAAWFQGLSATGSALGPLEIVTPGNAGGWLARTQRGLATHVHSQLEGSPGGIAAAFASGDRGGISKADEQAMRDSGLTHLLSVSGLHVSAVMAGAWFLAMSLLALWPWLALRVRLPVMAAAVSAGAGLFYTLLTGAEVPTVRSLAGAILVLIALAIGREPLSLRLLALAALLVMVLWPETVVGPSFQMSFASVLAIVALHGSSPVRGYLAPREQDSWWNRRWRGLVMLMLTGVVIELALMPVALYHFHRAGIYGSLANTIAIPLTTFISMPLIALALLFDLAGAGAPLWWLAGKSLEALLGLAHWTAARPGAVNFLPAMGEGRFAMFLAGALWLALWRGRIRLLGLIPAGLAALSLFLLRPPDLLISGDGRHAGITGEAKDRLLVLREGSSSYARDNLNELAGMDGEALALADWPGARCNRDYCAIELTRAGRGWHLLLARGMDPVPERALAAACERSDMSLPRAGCRAHAARAG